MEKAARKAKPKARTTAETKIKKEKALIILSLNKTPSQVGGVFLF